MGVCVKEVLADVATRNIRFPTSGHLLHLESSLTASIHGSNQHSLLEVVLRHMLVEVVNWKETWHQLEATTLSTAGNTVPVRVVLLGPNTASLRMPRSSPKVRNVEIVHGPWVDRAPPPRPDDIAIVGMSVNFPSGNGMEQFWETLKNGKSTVSEVGNTLPLKNSPCH